MRTLLALILFTLSAATAAELFDLKADLAERNKRAKAQSHCIGDETVVFTCNISGKIASICASELNSSQQYVQYRFGKRNKIELELPQKSGYKPVMVAYMNAMVASGYANYVRFTKNSYHYYIFNSSVRGENDPGTGVSTRIEPSGIAVAKDGKIIYHRRCSTPAFDHNVGEHFWGKAVVTLNIDDDVNPFDIAFPVKP